MATSVTSSHRIHWSNDWNQDGGVFASFSLLQPKLVLSSFPFFWSTLSFSSVSWCGLLWHRSSRCCERMTICLWWRVMIGRPLESDMCCQFRVSWNSWTGFNLFQPEVWWQKYKKRRVVFCRSDTKVSRAMTWLAAGADTPSTCEKPLAQTRPGMHSLFRDPQTQWMTQRREWIMQQSIFIH